MSSAPASERHEPEVVRDDELLRVWFLPGDSDRLVVSFCGIGLDGEEVQSPEFLGSARGEAGNPVLFIADKARSWLNAPGIVEEIAATIRRWTERSGAAQVSMLGNSMGGFMAMVMPAHVPTVASIGFSPQFSIDPEIARETRRWQRWRERISEIRIRQASDYLVPRTAYYVIHGDHGRERTQSLPYVGLTGVRHFVMPRTIHNTAWKLRRRKALAEVVAFAVANRPRRLKQALGRVGVHESRRDRAAEETEKVEPESRQVAPVRHVTQGGAR
ncbi:MAG: hypothetical protein H6895_04735 [Defluviimonas sp.]|uniref:hypothetical protein n=1 Tax=Albidovulum sp. TaxID=1872424 RepID=UPI002A350F3A|nr:hypothetical protein [Defluviimonas sp.]